ncbi:MAG: glycosyltransferase family 2 protein [Schwartzia sp.]|nr:glycosyltransferase family 2 protein [Schwartzia sp. (in: firmicutes)]
MRISACYIVRDEAKKLDRSLCSIKGAVDEIVVVDTGSIDDTVEVAEAHGAHVFHFSWRDDFSAARNVSLSNATGDWILVMDADEYFPDGMGKNIRPAVERYGGNADLILFMHRDVDETDGKVLLESYVPRILRRVEGLAYEGIIHEEPRHQGKTITRIAAVPAGELMMLHTGYSVSSARTKGERNLALLQKELSSGCPRDSIYMYLAETYDGLDDEENALKCAWLDVDGGRKNYVFASRSYRILLRILASRPNSYHERLKAACLAVRDFPELPEFHAEYAECLSLGFNYQGAIEEGNKALVLAKAGTDNGMEPSKFDQAAEEMLAERMGRWRRLLQYEADEVLLQQAAAAGNWQKVLQESEQAIWKQGERLFALLLLMGGDDAEIEATQLAENMLPPEIYAVWKAYKHLAPVDKSVEGYFVRLVGDVVNLVSMQGAELLIAFARAFSEGGKTATARILMEAEAWGLALPLLEEIPDNIGGEVCLMKGVCFYHAGDWEKAKRLLLRAQDIFPSAEASSYLRWIEEASNSA